MKGQSSCSTAILLSDPGDEIVVVNDTMTTSEMWFKYTTSQDVRQFWIQETDGNNNYDITSLKVYSGNCNGLTEVFSDTITPSDTVLSNVIFEQQQNTTYYIRLKKSSGNNVNFNYRQMNRCFVQPPWTHFRNETYSNVSGAFNNANRIIIIGTFTFDQTVSVSNKEIIMYTTFVGGSPVYARIVLNNNVELTLDNGTHVHDCYYIWDRIEVDDASERIITDSATIEGALYAIRSSNGGDVNLSNSSFFSNLEHIRITDFPNQIHPFVIRNCTIQTNGNLPRPRQNDISDFGIRIENVGSINIGDASLDANQNYMEDFRLAAIGMKNVDTAVIVNNFITNAGTANTGTTNDYHRGIWLWNCGDVQIGGSLANEPNTINDFDQNVSGEQYGIGIFSDGTDYLSIWDNDFNNNKVSIGITNHGNQNVNNPLDIYYNEINTTNTRNGSSAIYLSGNPKMQSANIISNILNLSINTKYGIRYEETTTQQALLNIIDNTIKNGYRSIYVQKAADAYIGKNRIFYYVQGSNNTIGIWVNDCDDPIIRDNTVKNVETSVSKRGIVTMSTFHPEICNNQTEYMDIGIAISGINAETRLYLNKMSQCNTGFFNASDGDYHSPQGFPDKAWDNQWYMNVNWDTYNNHDNSSGYTPPDWWVQGTTNPYHPNPGMNGNCSPNPLCNSIIFHGNQNSGNPGCTTNPHPPLRLSSAGSHRLFDLRYFTDYDNSKTGKGNWMTDYRRLTNNRLRNIEQSTDTAALNYLNLMESRVIGKLNRVDYLIKEAAPGTPFENQQQLLQAWMLNNSIEPLLEIESQLKYANSIYLQMLLNGKDSLSRDEIGRLKSIAGQCIFEALQPVSRARFILSSFGMTDDWQDDCMENAPENPNRSQGRLASNDEMIKVFPNPAGNSFTIRYNHESEETLLFILSDLTGHEIQKIPLRGKKGEVTIHTKQLSNGLYIYWIDSGNLPVKAGKLVITGNSN